MDNYYIYCDYQLEDSPINDSTEFSKLRRASTDAKSNVGHFRERMTETDESPTRVTETAEPWTEIDGNSRTTLTIGATASTM